MHHLQPTSTGAAPPRALWRRHRLVQRGGLIALLLLAAELAAAQTVASAPLRVAAKTLGREVTMPFVQGGPAGVAGRINQAVWIDTLERPAPAQRSDAVALSDDEQRMTPSARFKLLRHDTRVLSLVLDLEGCGAYCEGYQRPFAFDPRDGRLLLSADLFTASGLQALQPRLAAQRAAQVQRQIRLLQQQIARDQRAQRQPEEGAEDALALYQDCLQRWLPSADPVYRELRHEQMAIGPQHISFTAGRCSNHAMRALDVLGDFTNRLPIASLRAQLSPYGRAVLLGETGPDARPASGLLSQVLRGTLDGKLPITLRLLQDAPAAADGSQPVGGSYFYDRVRRLIPLSGTLQGDQLTLTEGEHSDDARAPVFRLTVSGQGLRGSWRHGERTLPVEITP